MRQLLEQKRLQKVCWLSRLDTLLFLSLLLLLLLLEMLQHIDWSVQVWIDVLIVHALRVCCLLVRVRTEHLISFLIRVVVGAAAAAAAVVVYIGAIHMDKVLGLVPPIFIFVICGGVGVDAITIIGIIDVIAALMKRVVVDGAVVVNVVIDAFQIPVIVIIIAGVVRKEVVVVVVVGNISAAAVRPEGPTVPRAVGALSLFQKASVVGLDGAKRLDLRKLMFKRSALQRAKCRVGILRLPVLVTASVRWMCVCHVHTCLVCHLPITSRYPCSSSSCSSHSSQRFSVRVNTTGSPFFGGFLDRWKLYHEKFWCHSPLSVGKRRVSAKDVFFPFPKKDVVVFFAGSDCRENGLPKQRSCFWERVWR